MTNLFRQRFQRSAIILIAVLAAAHPWTPALAGDVVGQVRFEPRRRLDRSREMEVPDTSRAVVFLRGEGMVTPRRGGPLSLELVWSDAGPEPPMTIARLHDKLHITNEAQAPRRLYLFSGSTTRGSGLLSPGGRTEELLGHFGPIEIYDPTGRNPGYVLVLENPFHKMADKDGRFLMDGVPPGSYQVCAWGPGRPVACVPVEIPFEGRVEAAIIVP